MASFDEFYESLPEDSNKRGEYFEKVFVPWFLKTEPEWSSQIQQVWLWDDYPQRWGKDCGIDLVYEDPQGKHWAVQSKCVSPDREISKAEIDSFLSESSDPRIHGRLLIASTDGIGKNAQQVIDRQEKQVVCFLLEHFRHSAVEFPCSPEDLSTGHRKEKRTPRPHQQEAIRNVVEGFQKEDRGQLLMACGTGKTLTSLWIKEALNAKRTLVLVPSLGLLSQILREWTATSQQQFNWICVCSDKSVAKQDKAADSMIQRVSDLGVPVTSDPKDIQDFLEKEEGGVIFSTYQSSELVAESQKNQSTPGFDITFADEAHRCTGKISSAFACVLDGERIRSDKRLFMTATPRVLSKQIKKKADEENIHLACMDDVSQFGEVFHQLNFSEAIDRELLSDYKVVIVGVDDPSVEAKIIDRSIVQTRGDLEIDTETLANHIALVKAIKDYDLSRMITFHSRVKSAKKFSDDHPLIIDWIPEGSKSPKSSMTSYVSGEMNTKTRNNEITKLRNISEKEVGILANSRCLSEGVDVPTLDGIAFFDPRSSQVDIIQAVGRAIRKSKNKKDGYIILPIYLGDTTNAENQILQSRFKDIWNIILALKSQDDSLRDELDQLRVELGRRNTPTEQIKGFSKIIFDLPSSIPETFANSLSTILVAETTETWMEMLGKLIQYFNTNGHSKVPQRESKLGKWVQKQREARNNNRLTSNQIQHLNDVNFCWDPIYEAWQERYELLKEYIAENGNARVPRGHPELGSWVATQRTARKTSSLSNHQLTQLDKIGFSWNPEDEYWDEKFQIYKNLVENEGIKNFPTNHSLLGNWITVQRKSWAKGNLKNERLRMLEEIGFVFDPKKEEWIKKFEAMKAYIKETGSSKIKKRDKELGNWVTVQRRQYAKGKLDKDKINLLESIEFIWEADETNWQGYYQKLKKYISENGHCMVPRDNPDIGNWVSNQRSKKVRNKLPKEHFELLDSIGFIWDVPAFLWNRKYQLLQQFKAENNHVLVPCNHPELGSFVSNLRQSKEKLTNEQVKLLNEIGFEWTLMNKEWEIKYSLLKEYVQLNGNAKVPQQYPEIGQWVRRQRVSKKSGKLSQERIRLLDKIGFIWDASSN